MLNAGRYMYHVPGGHLPFFIGDSLDALSTEEIEYLLAIRMGVAFMTLTSFQDDDPRTERFRACCLRCTQPFDRPPVQFERLDLVRLYESLIVNHDNGVNIADFHKCSGSHSMDLQIGR